MQFQFDTEDVSRVNYTTPFELQAAIITEHKDKNVINEPSFINFPSQQGIVLLNDESEKIPDIMDDNSFTYKTTQQILQSPINVKVYLTLLQKQVDDFIFKGN